LPRGVWRCNSKIQFGGGKTTQVSDLKGAVNSVSGGISGTEQSYTAISYGGGLPFNYTLPASLVLGIQDLNLQSTTTEYLNAGSEFTGGMGVSAMGNVSCVQLQ